MRNILTMLALAGTFGCSHLPEFSTMNQDMRGANKISGTCFEKAKHLYGELVEEGIESEIVLTDLGNDRYHALVRHKDKSGKWIYLDPSFETRDIICKGRYLCSFSNLE